MNFSRLLAYLAVSGVVAVGIFFPLLWWSDQAFQTAHRFVTLVKQHRFDEAMAMIPPEDRGKIPESYWQQFERNKPIVLTSPTPGTFFNHRMALRFSFPVQGETYSIGSGIDFEVNGNLILVCAVRFRGQD